MFHIKTVVTILILLYISSLTRGDTQNDPFDIHTTEDHDDHDDHDESSNGENIGRAIGITVFAGCASFVGAFSIFCIRKEYVGVLPASLAFSSGVTVHLTFMSLIPEAIALLGSKHLDHSESHDAHEDEDTDHDEHEESETANKALAEFYVLLCVILGILITLGMEKLFDKLGVHNHQINEPETATKTETDPTSTTGAKQTTSGVISPMNIVADTSKVMNGDYGGYSRVSYSIAFALILHHLPEGIATFVSLYYDFEFGILVALALALHDIPSGVCIGVPCYLASGSYKKPFLLCAIAGCVYPIGALIGWAILKGANEEVVDGFIGVLLGVTGGIMLYISFVELLPTAIIAANKYSSLNKSKYGINTISIILLFIGFLVMAISKIVLESVGGHSH